MCLYFFPLKLVAGHQDLLEETVSWKDEDLDFISRPTVMVSQNSGLYTAFGFLGERYYLNAKFLKPRFLCAAVKCVFVLLCEGRMDEKVDKWSRTMGN